MCGDSSVGEVCYGSFCDFAGVEGFAELTVGAAFAGGVVAVVFIWRRRGEATLE